ncbi:transcriptional repressor NrdR [Candidatus Micrarchaeota archaeon]|nr:transcriptional repressor NrdR [Candidatus Micrarchaeota archaeon]MBD3417869.1 transcriptional repressor NrdR [Candidatus Micrarchaeota archaeon]
MKCPYCTNEETKVVDSRQVESQIRRRRQCEKCEKRFTTFERVEYAELYVIKKNGSRQPFNSEKLRTSIRKACEKRPISLSEIEEMVSSIEARLRNEDSIEIKSSRVGNLVMKSLRKADPVAYIRFASVYRDFGDLEAFVETIEKLKKGGSNGRK